MGTIERSINLNNSEIAEFVRANNGGVDQDLVDFFLLTYVDCKDDPFPVSGEMAQQWIGFTRKDNFKRFVMNAGLEEDVDFRLSLPKSPRTDSSFSEDNVCCLGIKASNERIVKHYYGQVNFYSRYRRCRQGLGCT